MTTATITHDGRRYTATLIECEGSRPAVRVAVDDWSIGEGIWGADGIEGDIASQIPDEAYDALCAALDRAERGAALASRRVAAGLTQVQFAARLGVSRETIVRRESGALPITREAALAVEAALDAAGAEIVECECGEWSGEACAWFGPRSETVRVRYVPGQWRGTAEAAGTWRGVAAAMRVSPECAERIAEHDPDWTERA
jgi:transcriptional regulator with XRE-family HTH domain